MKTTHLVVFKDQDRTSMQITRDIAEKLSDFRKNSRGTVFTFRDSKGDILKEVGKHEILDVKGLDGIDGVRKWICDYGTRHLMHNACECETRYKTHWSTFKQWMHKHFNLQYASDITTYHQQQFLNTLSHEQV